jgi:bifunctional DNA-binding transcriptional regulator/antitoxin component of YhaV-PrlF toxin-antitoxin module
MEYETFLDEVKDINGVFRVTIPAKLVSFAGIKQGDQVKVMIKKV